MAWSVLPRPALVLLAVAGCGSVDPPPVLDRPETIVRLMTFNIRYAGLDEGDRSWESRRAAVYEVLLGAEPDVLGLQEASDRQVEDIVRAIPELVAVSFGAEDGIWGGVHSPILLRVGRLQVVDSGVFWLSDEPDEPGSRTWGNRQARICTWALLRDRRTGARLAVFNTHLDHRSEESRGRGLRAISDRAQRVEAPVIVMGDLNLERTDPSFSRLLRGLALTDPLAPPPGAAITGTGTYHGFRGGTDGVAVDFILVGPGVDSLGAEVLRQPGSGGRFPSDHFPVLVTVRVRALGLTPP